MDFDYIVYVLFQKKAPSPTIPYTAVNVLYGYAYMCRLHNGGHHQTPIDAVEVIYSIRNLEIQFF